MAMAKTGGIELTGEEAKAYMAELTDFELDADTLKNVAGGAASRIARPRRGYEKGSCRIEGICCLAQGEPEDIIGRQFLKNVRFQAGGARFFSNRLQAG